MAILTKACANFQCRHQIEAQPGDNPYDSECDQCKSRVCLLCGSFTHFPASCKERERWIQKAMHRVNDKTQKKWQEWGDKVFEHVSTELQTLKSWRLAFGPGAFVAEYGQVAAAFDEMEKIMQMWRWVVVIACCNTHLGEAIKTHLQELIEKRYDDLRMSIPSPQKLHDTELSHFNAARQAAAKAVRDLLSMLLKEKSTGGRYRPPASSTVIVVNPDGSPSLGIPTDYVDTTILPAPAGVPPDEGVDWNKIMRDALNTWDLGGGN